MKPAGLNQLKNTGNIEIEVQELHPSYRECPARNKTTVTAQIGEKIYYQGQGYSMCSEPLHDYFSLGGEKPDFMSPSTALWRGYTGTWEIVNDRLYLIELAGHLEGGFECTLETIFPGFPDRVFAHWYSGTLRIPEGKMLEYVHQGYGSTYERDIKIKISRGCVTDLEVVTNGTSTDPDAPEGYGTGAMTVLPNSQNNQ